MMSSSLSLLILRASLFDLSRCSGLTWFSHHYLTLLLDDRLFLAPIDDNVQVGIVAL